MDDRQNGAAARGNGRRTSFIGPTATGAFILTAPLCWWQPWRTTAPANEASANTTPAVPVPSTPAKASPPRLTASAWHHDFGSVAPSEECTHRFEVTNSGRRDLTVAVIDKSCGCTSAGFDSETIKPGGKGFLNVAFHVPNHPGGMSHHVIVGTNDPARQRAKFTFAARAEWAVELLPAECYVGALTPGKSADQEVELASMTGEAFEVTRVEPSEKWLKVERVRGADARRRLFRVTVLRPDAVGPFDAEVVFHTTSKKRARLSLGIRGEFSTLGAISPASFVLGSRMAGAEAKLFMTIRTRGEDAGVEKLSVSDPAWEVRDWTVRHTKSATIVVEARVRVPGELGRHKSSVVIAVGGEREPLKASISCLVRGRS